MRLSSGFAMLLLVSRCAVAADAMVYSWTPPDVSKIGQAFSRGQTVTVPAGQTAVLVTGDRKFLTLRGHTTYSVPATREPTLVESLIRLIREFAAVPHVRSGADESSPLELWVIDPKQSGPQCLQEKQVPAIWAAVGSPERDFKVTDQSGKSGFVRVPRDRNTAEWPPTLPFELGYAYTFTSLYDNTVVERTFKSLPKPAQDDTALTDLLEAECVAQAGVALSKFERRTIGPEQKQ